MAQHDMRHFVSQDYSQARFIRKNVQQPTADHDCASDRKRFQWRRQQYATARLRSHLQVVGDLDIADHCFQDLIHITVGRHQTGDLQALDDVIFPGILVRPMTQRRTQVVSGIALPASRIRHYINERLRKFPQIASVSQVVSPDASLRPVAQLGGRVQWLVGVLAVGVRGKPHVGQQVQPPTVKMNFRLARVRDIRAVKPNDVIILVFHPDPAQEALLS